MKRIKAVDIILIILLCVLSLIPQIALGRGSADELYIRVSTPDGVRQYSAGKEERLELSSNGCHLTVQITPDGVCVSDADCPDHLCVRTGTVHRAGAAIVCVPARVCIEIVSAGEDLDVVTG